MPGGLDYLASETRAVAERRARAGAARSGSAAIAALAGGAGAELVARQQMAREALAALMEEWAALSPAARNARVAARLQDCGR